MQPNSKSPVRDLFYAELIDLKREVMVWGLILPIMVLGYVGLLVSYQEPFLEHPNYRAIVLFAVIFFIGLGCALLNRTHRQLALWLTSWSTLVIALAFFVSGLDGYTALGVSVACGAIALLLHPLLGWLAVLLSGCAISAYAMLYPQLHLWPGRVAVVVITSIFATIIAQAVARVLFRALRWTQTNYEMARQQAETVTEKSSQLAAALKSLERTSFQLARANEQMEVAMRYAEEARLSKQQFAASVSHELRAPLNLIIGFSDLVVNEPEHYHTDLDPKLLADIRVINNHAQHLLKLVNDILDLSQMDVNYLTVVQEPVQVSEIVQEAIADFNYLVTQHGLRLEVDIEPGLPTVMADATRIREVLTNLLSNALRVTSQGEISVQARRWVNDNQQAPSTGATHEILVSVRDTGMGISEADLRRIFEPFVQIAGSDPQKHSGSGLGLTISRKFVELHGGRMWVDSTLGQGSTFYFTIPVAGAEPASSPQRTMREMKRREVGTLTVVERSAVLSRLVERHITGMQVESVPSIDDLCIDSDRSVEVILINEPFTGGGQLPELPAALHRVPVFRCYVHEALSSLRPNENLSGGLHDYLIKPVNREQLYAVLKRLLSAEPGKQNRPAHVLIVEDEEDASYMLNRMLRLAPPEVFAAFDGITITRARSGEQALQILEGCSEPGGAWVDAVLLDLVLGSLSGFAVLSEMELHPSWRSIPVCVITGQVATGDLLVTPYLSFSRQGGLTARELAQAVTALTKIALPGVEVAAQ